MLLYILMFFGLILGGLLFAGLQRKYSQETIVNGFMDIKKDE